MRNIVIGILVFLFSSNFAFADLKSDTEQAVCDKVRRHHDFTMMMTVNGICLNYTAACVGTTVKIANICSISEWNESDFSLRINLKNQYLGPTYWHQADANVKCLFTSNYEWACFYEAGNFAYQDNSSTKFMSFAQQESYISSFLPYLEENL